MALLRKRKISQYQRKMFSQIISALPDLISAIHSDAQAEEMESNIWKLRTAGLISDQEYLNYLQQIMEKYK